MRLIFALCSLLLLPAAAEPGNLVVISWDGSHPQVVKDLLAAGRLPTVQGLLNAGAQWRDLTITDQLPDYTVTKPGHAQMLTGQPKTVTGVYSNDLWSVIPVGMTLPEQWQAAGAFVGWTSQKNHLREYNSGAKTGIKGPFWNVWQTADCLHSQDSGSSAQAIDAALVCLGQAPVGKRVFLFVHTQYPDHAGHKHGAGSPDYQQALVDNDAALARLLAALPAQTQVVLTTDHGFGTVRGVSCPPYQGTQHHDCPDTWMVSQPPLPMAGSRLLDLAPALRP